MAVSLLAVAAWWPAIAAAQPGDAEQLVTRYATLHARGDVDALLALHTPDSEFVLPGRHVVRGTKELRAQLESAVTRITVATRR